MNSIKIAYIGGGSFNWAWKLFNDLSKEDQLTGKVSLYDINFEAALINENIAKSICNRFEFKAENKIEDALNNADFVFISISPGTLNEMYSDVHTPEKYGIYQSVGDTTGPGGIMRGIRLIPMLIEITQFIEKHCPNAWVINFTNPMTICMDTLYKVFPKIKSFGCCGEVLKTHRLLTRALKEIECIDNASTEDVKINVVGINHFTWITKAFYNKTDIFPIYSKFIEKYKETGIDIEKVSSNYFASTNKVKFDLYLRSGLIAAAGDRHLAEFCPQSWYLKTQEIVNKWGFALTPVNFRMESSKQKEIHANQIISGLKQIPSSCVTEDCLDKIKAILGLGDYVAYANLPNLGQINNICNGTIVETNALFTSNQVLPICSGELPHFAYSLSIKPIENFKYIVDCCLKKDLKSCINAFVNDPLLTNLSPFEAEELFNKMINNTREYLKFYNV